MKFIPGVVGMSNNGAPGFGDMGIGSVGSPDVAGPHIGRTDDEDYSQALIF